MGAPVPSTRAPRFLWKLAWDFGKKSLSILHNPYLTSGYVPSDRNVNLSVLYWKALDGDEYARALLPGRLGRLFTSRAFRWMYPRLHHANVGIRTRFINRCLESVVAEEEGGDGGVADITQGFNVLILGAGFDSRGVRLLDGGGVVDKGKVRVVEFDLEGVVKEKGKVFERNYRRRRRRRRKSAGWGGSQEQLPILTNINLNYLEGTRATLSDEIQEGRR